MQPPKNIEALFAALLLPAKIEPEVPAPVKKNLPPTKTKYIETPAKMWELFLAYKELIKSNPKFRVEQKRGTVVLPKDISYSIKIEDTVKIPLERPLTMEGFYNYLDHQGIITDATDYFENKGGRYAAYIQVCTRVKRTIRDDQITGGMVGNYNPSITQRLNNLAERTQLEKLEQPLFPDDK